MCMTFCISEYSIHPCTCFIFINNTLRASQLQEIVMLHVLATEVKNDACLNEAEDQNSSGANECRHFSIVSVTGKTV